MTLRDDPVRATERAKSPDAPRDVDKADGAEQRMRRPEVGLATTRLACDAGVAGGRVLVRWRFRIGGRVVSLMDALTAVLTVPSGPAGAPSALPRMFIGAMNA
jgi:hypothetical protein